MNWLVGGLVILFFLLAVVFGWRYYRLRRRLDAYTRILHQAVSRENDGLIMPLDVPGLENLSNSVSGIVDILKSQLASSETNRARLAAILEQMNDGVVIVDSEGGTTYMNPAAVHIFNVQIDPGQRVTEILRQFQLVEAWKRAMETGEEQSETIELPSSHQFINLFVIPDPHTGGTFILAQDLTRVRKLESIRRDFISNVSHELRTPLASLKALTETLRDGALEDTEVASKFLKRIETEVDALTQMAQELLDLTRIESGQVPLELSAVNPIHLLHASAERMQVQVERAGLELTLETTNILPPVLADAVRIEQVLVNLLHNAIKYTPPPGMITLSVHQVDKVIRFIVQDTGIGIPEEDLGRIFERFFKTDRARTGGGTGLGLSISRHIVEAHGGKIWAESREGEGSSFFFTIPCS